VLDGEALVVYLKQNAGMIRGSPGCSWRSSIKTEIMQIKFVDEDIHYTDRVVVGDIVIEIFG
jgi:hypothetical protein